MAGTTDFMEYSTGTAGAWRRRFSTLIRGDRAQLRLQWVSLGSILLHYIA
jgi:hypothetical protein